MELAVVLDRVRAISRAELGFAAKAWLGAFPVELSLATLGLMPTLRWIEAVSAKGNRPGVPRAALPVALGERAVHRAYKVHPLRGRCLPRSLVQYLLHRRKGQAVHFVIGVRRGSANEGAKGLPAWKSMEAHAWVEAAGASRGGERRHAEFAVLLVAGDSAKGSSKST